MKIRIFQDVKGHDPPTPPSAVSKEQLSISAFLGQQPVEECIPQGQLFALWLHAMPRFVYGALAALNI